MINTIIIIALVCGIGFAIVTACQRYRKGSACCGEHEETVARVKSGDRNKKHYPYKATLNIGGMTCENCAIRVENALNSLPDVLASVDIATKKATILTKEPLDEQSIRNAVSQAGYIVMSIE